MDDSRWTEVLRMLTCHCALAMAAFAFGPAAAWSELCKRHLAAGDCDFYRGCLDRVFPCGESGYALTFGDKYCRRFNNYSAELLDERASARAHRTSY